MPEITVQPFENLPPPARVTAGKRLEKAGRSQKVADALAHRESRQDELNQEVMQTTRGKLARIAAGTLRQDPTAQHFLDLVMDPTTPLDELEAESNNLSADSQQYAFRIIGYSRIENARERIENARVTSSTVSPAIDTPPSTVESTTQPSDAVVEEPISPPPPQEISSESIPVSTYSNESDQERQIRALKEREDALITEFRQFGRSIVYTARAAAPGVVLRTPSNMPLPAAHHDASNPWQKEFEYVEHLHEEKRHGDLLEDSLHNASIPEIVVIDPVTQDVMGTQKARRTVKEKGLGHGVVFGKPKYVGRDVDVPVVVGQEPVTARELTEVDSDEPVYRIQYFTPPRGRGGHQGKLVMEDFGGRPGNVFDMRFFVPKSLAEKIGRVLTEDPTFIQKLVVEEYLDQFGHYPRPDIIISRLTKIWEGIPPQLYLVDRANDPTAAIDLPQEQNYDPNLVIPYTREERLIDGQPVVFGIPNTDSGPTNPDRNPPPPSNPPPPNSDGAPEPSAALLSREELETRGQEWAHIIRDVGKGYIYSRFDPTWKFTVEGQQERVIPRMTRELENAGVFGGDEISVCNNGGDTITGPLTGIIRRKHNTWNELSDPASYVILAPVQRDGIGVDTTWRAFDYVLNQDPTYSMHIDPRAQYCLPFDFRFVLPGPEGQRLTEQLRQNPELMEPILQGVYPGLIGRGENQLHRISVPVIRVVDWDRDGSQININQYSSPVPFHEFELPHPIGETPEVGKPSPIPGTPTIKISSNGFDDARTLPDVTAIRVAEKTPIPGSTLDNVAARGDKYLLQIKQDALDTLARDGISEAEAYNYTLHWIKEIEKERNGESRDATVAPFEGAPRIGSMKIYQNRYSDTHDAYLRDSAALLIALDPQRAIQEIPGLFRTNTPVLGQLKGLGILPQ